MRCHDIQLLLAAHGELSVQEARQIREHLASCQACTERSQQLERARSALLALPAREARVPARVSAAIDALVAGTDPRRSPWRSRIVLAGAALAALVLGLLLQRNLIAGPQRPGNAGTAGNGTTIPAAVTPEASTPITITFGTWKIDRPTHEPLIQQFNRENPDIHVELVALEDLPNDFPSFDGDSAQLAGAAEVLLVSGNRIMSKHFHDLKPFMNADPSIVPGDYLPGLFEALTEDGAIYKLPRSFLVETIHYNKQYWAEAGLPEPTNDWTWPELTAAAQALARKQGNNVEVYGLMEFTTGSDVLLHEYELAGGDVKALVTGQAVNLTDPAFEQALSRLAEYRASGAIYAPLLNESDYYAEQRRVREGGAGMWGVPNVTEDPRPAEGEGVIAFPASWNSRLTTNSYVMSRGTSHPEAAWRLLSFLFRQSLPETKNWNVPARNTPVDQAGSWDQLDPAIAPVLRATVSRLGPDTILDHTAYHYLLSWQAVAQAKEAVFTRGQTPREALAAAQRWIEEQRRLPTATPVPLVMATPVAGVKRF